MKLKLITRRAVTVLLTVVLFTGCLIPHAANNETAHEAGGIPDPLISTTSNIDVLPELSTDSTLLSDPESLAEAESAYRERMQRECAEGILADSIWDIQSYPVGKTINVLEIIKETLTDEMLEEDLARIDRRYNQEKCFVDKDRFILEYNVPTTYWENVKSANYKCLTEQLNEYPSIYVPVLANIVIDDEQSTRVVGHYKLYYDFALQHYATMLSLMNSTSQSFISGDNIHFYEIIGDYIDKNTREANQAIIIRYPDSLNDYMEKIAIVFNDDNDPVILDFSNSLHLDAYQQKNSYYSVNEYKELRMKVEKEIYNSYTSVDNMMSGGRAGSNNNSKSFSNNTTIKIVIILTTVFLLTISTILILSKSLRRKERRKT